ncbi:YggT family protein [Candidatus Saccharibacteria bacterium]|nr:YggT family protein [Candidatus Saccharibacteria bacterium]
MQNDTQDASEVTTTSSDNVQKSTESYDSRPESDYSRNVLAKIIGFITGITLVLLTLRFLLSLLGASTANVLTNFVYNISLPLVAPFFTLFNYNEYVYGVSRFEGSTLVAIVFYGLVAWGIAKLVTLNRR